MYAQLTRAKKPSKPPEFNKKPPLVDSHCKSILLDSCYLISVITSGYHVADSLQRLKGENSRLVVTPQVISELENIASSGRRENGRFVLTSKEMCELRECLYNGAVEIESVEISDLLRKTARKLLRKRSQKKNERVGEGELSLMAAAHKLGLASLSWEIRSHDSDVQALFA